MAFITFEQPEPELFVLPLISRLVSIWSSGSSRSPQSFQKFLDQQDDWHDWWFPYNRLDRLKDKSRTCFANKPNMMEGFNKRANLVVCYLLILSILWPNKVEMFHEDTASHSELDGRDYLFFTYCAYAVRTLIFVFLPDYWNKSDDFWGSLRSSQSSESVSLWSIQNLHDRPDLSKRSRSSLSSLLIVWTLFETTGTIIRKPGFSDIIDAV